MSNQDQDFTDYHQHAWNVITPPPSRKTLHLIATPVTVLLSLAISNFIDHYYYPYSGVDAQIAFIVPLMFSLFILASLQCIVVHLIHLHGPHLQKNSLTKEGFHLGHTHLQLDQINPSGLKIALDSYFLPNKSSWNNTTTTSSPLFLNLPLKPGRRTLKLTFNREHDRQRVIQSLKHYFVAQQIKL